MAAEDPSLVMLYQYGNEATRAPTTRRTGPEILRDLPEIDVFVAGLGTGGTLTGTGRYLKERKPSVKIVAAAPHPGDRVQGLRSLDEGFIPPVLDEIAPRRPHRRRLAELVRGDEGADGEGRHLRRHLRRRRPASRPARRRAHGARQHRLLLADGGWKYLSTDLWTTDYDNLAEDLDDKIWW